MGLFHITSRAEWDRAQAAGEYRPASLATEGFIHLSGDRQWLAVANRFYRGQPDLVLLSIGRDRLTAPLRYDHVDGQAFPHLYGPLNLDAVVEACALPVDATGAIGVPPELAPWRAYFHGPPRVVATSPAFEALMRGLAPVVDDVALVAVRGTFYVCLGARSTDVPLRELMLAAAGMPDPPLGLDSAGWLRMTPFPRLSDGTIDEPALVAAVDALVRHD